MKKTIYVFLVAALLIGLLPNAVFASEYTGGLLDNVEMETVQRSSTLLSTYNDVLSTGVTSFVTDNNVSTSNSFTSSYGVAYTFSKTHDITDYILTASGQHVALIFYDENNQVITTPYGYGNYFYMSMDTKINIDVKNVKKFIVMGGGGGTYQFKEFNLFGSPSVHIPAAPELTATSGNTNVSLIWIAVDEAESYNVKRSLSEGGPYTTIEEAVYGTTYTDLDVINGTTYYYIVTAVNDLGESDSSNEASATPVAPPAEGRAIVVVAMDNGLEREYDWTMTQVNAFIDWYDDRAEGTGPAKYTVVKNYNKGPFLTRKEYLLFNKIVTFEVMEYEVEEE